MISIIGHLMGLRLLSPAQRTVPVKYWFQWILGSCHRLDCYFILLLFYFPMVFAKVLLVLTPRFSLWFFWSGRFRCSFPRFRTLLFLVLRTEGSFVLAVFFWGFSTSSSFFFFFFFFFFKVFRHFFFSFLLILFLLFIYFLLDVGLNTMNLYVEVDSWLQQPIQHLRRSLKAGTSRLNVGGLFV